MPLVYIMECEDGRYRLTLVFRVEGETWLGRYLYHLPTTYTVAEMKSDAPLAMETLREELVAGCDTLRNLMERDARGEWAHPGAKVDIGSYSSDVGPTCWACCRRTWCSTGTPNCWRMGRITRWSVRGAI
jgi:hypothetical protein